jgi:hypothetical protein
MDEEARMNVYVAAMSVYPADVVRSVFDHFTRRPSAGTSWFPTLPEMIREADRLVSSRKVTIAALLAWKPQTNAERKASAIREITIEAMEIERAVFSYKRSEPERYASEMARAAKLHARAAKIRRGEIEP